MTALYEAIGIFLFFCLLIFVTTVPQDLGCKELDRGDAQVCVYINEKN